MAQKIQEGSFKLRFGKCGYMVSSRDNFDFAVAQELSGCFDLPLNVLRFVLTADEKNTHPMGHFSLDKWQSTAYLLTERLVKRVKRHEPGREGTVEMDLSDSFSRFTLTQALIPPELA